MELSLRDTLGAAAAEEAERHSPQDLTRLKSSYALTMEAAHVTCVATTLYRAPYMIHVTSFINLACS